MTSGIRGTDHSSVSIPGYIERRIRQRPPGGCCVVPGSTPVISFGDVSVARVATISINPSHREFSDGHIPLNRESVHDVLADCNGYFRREPYKSWFNQLEAWILQKCGASYYDGTACALDLVQWATDPVWSDLPGGVRDRLLAADGTFLKTQLEENKNVKLVLANGRQVIDGLQAMGFPLDYGESITPDGRQIHLFRGRLGERTFIGWNLNLQGSLNRTGFPGGSIYWEDGVH
ncbi:MAG: hypothetical protein F4061_18035, partial [Acidobacteria bacterium]|nr:hypothetical protein [Acidobacteriota bacterium]